METPEMGDPLAMDRGALLTVLQAADWANLSVSTVRRRLEDGDLRFEIVRDRGRDVQRIRWVDLCDLFPYILGGASALPTAKSAPKEAFASEADQPTSPAAKTPEFEVPATGTSVEGAPQQTPEIRAEERGLEISVQSLTEQRDDLRDQCYDLRIRLSAAEKERQASVGALLLAQKQALTVEGHSYPVEQGPFWKRPRNWSMLAASGLLLWFMSGMFADLKAGIQKGQTEWSQSLAAETQEHLQFQTQRLDSERRAMQEQLVRLNEHNEQQRAAIRTKLDQDQGDRQQLWQQVEALGASYSETQRMVQENLATESASRDRWATQQAETMGVQWATLRDESMQVLKAELATERDLNGKQQEALAASWRQREQRALQESERLARQVGDLVARVQLSESLQRDLTGRLQGSQALNAAYKSHLATDLQRLLARTVSRMALSAVIGHK